MSRLIKILFLLVLCIFSVSCQKKDLAENLSEEILLDMSKSQVEQVLKNHEIKFKYNAPQQNISQIPIDIVQEEELNSPNIVFFVSEQPTNAVTKTTRFIIVFDQNNRVQRMHKKDSYVGL